MSRLELGLQLILALCEQDADVHARLASRVRISQLRIADCVREHLLQVISSDWSDDKRARLTQLLVVCGRIPEPTGVSALLEEACIDALRDNVPFDEITAHHAIASTLAGTTILELHAERLRRYGADVIALPDRPPTPPPTRPEGRPVPGTTFRIVDGGLLQADEPPASPSLETGTGRSRQTGHA